jgi:hypothetical protein
MCGALAPIANKWLRERMASSEWISTAAFRYSPLPIRDTPSICYTPCLIFGRNTVSNPIAGRKAQT